MEDRSKTGILGLEFLSLEARLAYTEGVWGSVRPEVRDQAVSLMKRHGFTEYRALRTVLGHTKVQMAEIFELHLPTYQAIEAGEVKLCKWTSVYSQIRSVLIRCQAQSECHANARRIREYFESANDAPTTGCNRFEVRFGNRRNRYKGKRH